MSDEETCTSSETGFSRSALTKRPGSFLGSRMQSVECFEDAVETFEAPQSPTDGSGAGSSALALKLRLPRTPRSKDPVKGCTGASEAEAAATPAGSSSRRALTPVGLRGRVRDRAYNAAVPEGEAYCSARSSLCEAASEGSNEASAPSPPASPSEVQEKKQAAAEEAKSEQTSFRQEKEQLLRRMAEEAERNALPRSRLSTALQDSSRAAPKRGSVSRYASVPAYSAADKLRIRRFQASFVFSCFPAFDVTVSELCRLHRTLRGVRIRCQQP